MSDLKVSHRGNDKLGKKVSTISRSAGPSCDDSCQFLSKNGGNCYAEKIQRIYPNVEKAYKHNLEIKDWNKIRAFVLAAKKKGNSVRLHVAGDWMMTTKNGRKVLDKKYLNAWIKALESIDPADRPPMWMYTHCIDKSEILQLENLGVTTYASVDNERSLDTAKAAGFKRFAFGSDIRKGKADAKSEERDGKKTPYCFEQLGTKMDCESCGYCIKGVGDIVFLNH